MLDPVHGFIPITDTCKKIIDTPLFQRLGHIKQLTSAHYVFLSAQHTRKSHCIGAMLIAKKYIESILKHSKNKVNFLDEDKLKQNVEIAGLLHDIAHSAFSHSFDSTIYSQIYKNHKGHDEHRHVLLEYFKDRNSQKNTFNFDTDMISDIWKNKYPHLTALIQGVCGADRLDFLKRDAYFIGSNYGCFDIERIINNCWFDYSPKSLTPILVYDSKIVKTIIQGLNTRLYMYEEIYLHKTVIAVSVLIEMMILEAGKYINYVNKTKNIEEFININDNSVFNEILFSTSEELSLARKYAKSLYERKLPKMIEEKKIILNDEFLKEGEDIVSGISFIDANTIKWISRTLSKDFIEEFEHNNIYIGKGDNLLTFREYCEEEKITFSNEVYYFERIYHYE